MKKYKNKAEEAFAKKARDNGWMVTKRGYPDFICYKNGDVMLVEIKARKHHRLKKSQIKIMNISRENHGVKCYKWTPDSNWL